MTGAAPAADWVLTLYVNSGSTNSIQAIETVQRLCEEELGGRVELEVIDVRQHPRLVVSDAVIAAPTLVKRLPVPLRHLVGGLSDAARLRLGLDLGAVQASDGQGAGDPA